MNENESKMRSIVKSITWRLLATFTTIILVFAFTGEIVIALEIGGLELLLKLILYFFHERVWNNVGWGKISNNTMAGMPNQPSE